MTTTSNIQAIRPKESYLFETTSGNRLQSFCIGTQKHESLTEALLNTSLPSKIKKKFPSLRVIAYNRGMNSSVFKGNPYVDEYRRLPKEIFPKEIFDNKVPQLQGHPIQIKERLLGLSESANPKPELYLSFREKQKIQRLIQAKLLPSNQGKPLCILHVWSSNSQPTAPVEFWDALVSRWNGEFRFWQVGIENDSAVQGCEYYLLQKPISRNVRQLFALMSQAQAFMGIDSSSMHIARAFDLPSLIFLNPLAPPARKRYHYQTPVHIYGLPTHGIETADEFFGKLLKRSG